MASGRVTYSCLFSYPKYYPSEIERAAAKKMLERMEKAHQEVIEETLGGGSVEWILMGKEQETYPGDDLHWTMCGFTGDHAVMTLHLYSGQATSVLFMNGGLWGSVRSQGELFALPW
ncbi:hypothetical protein AGABI2DRAFT_146403 [Agaricus bisporus var. bisporus H97]|uniref:hypothetical protein n=1 Tax=Agaricus bisporus var. bisporus (strain H97 / ATCC MYA-4626 / FGSC 10389) TaxID=936046 RepID=UPI00029F7735|nr:hypothetical protein AGABI2DRAFT_146403 [Agaricus bisporus var. bisporus H97]EKV42940.1 hypothetical protein AGABI2DRAFT_146403 [Agaricus bisporus var. bisporus H97]